MQTTIVTPGKTLLVLFVLIGILLACASAVVMDTGPWRSSGEPLILPAPTEGQPVVQEGLPIVETRIPGDPIQSPTPDPPHPLPPLRTETETYMVQSGDTLNLIAQRFGVGLNDLVQANELDSPDFLEVGQVLTIPVPTPEGNGPEFKIIPDSELIYGPGSINFDVAAFVREKGGYLASYEEEVYEEILSGAEVIELIAREYSVNPRLLLAVLEYQSGWVTGAVPQEATLEYPIGVYESFRAGLYRQLAWAANTLNRGYYMWRVNGVAAWNLSDGSIVPVAPTINAGTAAIQHFFSPLLTPSAWEEALSQDGLFATYQSLFGYPFDYTYEPILPSGLAQPAMELPFERGEPWSYTGGPHGGWGGGSAWAALDFAPPGEALGCVASDSWVVAIADGLIVRAGNGAVVQDLDGDGFEQTGWTVLYMHIESRERVRAGTHLQAGERIGHPSCEGGVSSGTHVHLARRYNGEWIPADQDLPFNLDGWISTGTGYEYDGFLKRNGETVEAWEGRDPKNEIQR
jgi:murein DD-endopeptidase MepM/ murein hydrolase activator NlpD